MSSSQNIFQELVDHKFTQLGIKKGCAIQVELSKGNIFKAEGKYVRVPDEYEYYLIEVGQSLAGLFDLCEQLTHITLYLSSFSPTSSMKQGGITRARHIQYTIENYIIRTQSLLDRVLKLTNAVFNLGLDPKDCRYNIIVKNLHVKVTNVPEQLKQLEKMLKKYEMARHQIIHDSAFFEEDLHILEGLFLVYENTPKEEIEGFPDLIRYRTRKIIKQKIEEFDLFNEKIISQLIPLFDTFLLRYKKNTQLLSLKHDMKV